MPQSESTIEHAAHRFRIPVIKASEDAEEKCTDKGVVKVRHDEVGVRQLPVERSDGQHHTRQARDQKLKEKTNAKKHRHVETNLAAVHRAEPVENLDPCRYAYQKGGNGEEGVTD